MTAERFEAIVVGAGPAGLAAAFELAERGAATLLVDEQPGPGGQIYRAAEGAGEAQSALFGKSYVRGAHLIAALRGQSVDYRPETTVVNVDGGFSVDMVCRERLARVEGKVLILATGAYERPLAIPGWTLPGVMTAGAGQILAKQSRVVPSDRTVVAGVGPLIWLLAWQYARMGVRLQAVVIVENGRGPWQPARHLPGFLASPYARDALRYLATAYRTTRVVRARRIHGVAGEECAAGLVVEGRGGHRRTIPADTVLLHNGVMPNVNLAGAIGCELVWNAVQACWEPKTDDWQHSSRDGVYVAGDGGGVAGARVAECGGRLAAADALVRLGRLTTAERDRATAPWLAERRRHLTGRTFIDALFAPIDTLREAEPGTLICRCESVSLARAEAALAEADEALGAEAARLNHLKAMTRCGMGPCQGRMCGPSVAALLEGRLGLDAWQAGPPSHRFPVKPLRLSTLADSEIRARPETGGVRE